MSFRQDNRQPESIWLREASPALHAMGIPDSVLGEDKRWHHLLLHAYDPESGWSAEQLSVATARELLRLLSLQYQDRAGLELLKVVELRAK